MPKIDRWLETENGSDNDVIQVFVGLKLDTQDRFAFWSRASASFW
jgi:hypothetical protein